jgi:hypothetical protein
VIEHPESAGECERREHRRHDGCLHTRTGECARHTRSQQEHNHTEHTPELETRGETHEGSSAQHSTFARPEAGEHPEQRNDRLGRMTVDERDVSQPSSDCQQPDRDAGLVGEAETTEDVEEQRCDAQLDQERQRGQILHCAEERQLQGPRLQPRVGEGVRPAAGEQLLALVDEVDEVAGVLVSIEVGQAGGRDENGYPEPGERRTQKVPHLGRYRPLEG